VDQLLAGAGLDQVAGMTLASFDPRRLRGDGESHPYTLAARWLAQIADAPLADYRDRAGPPAALYFYCPGKGRGKTHLAAALAWELRRTRELVCFLHEEGYCTRLWSVPFEQREAAIVAPAERAWLTVLDDLGRLNPGPGVQNAWDGLVNRRLLRRRWLLVTSNFTLEELLDRGTLSEAAYSRLHQMTRGEYVYFDGEDQRLAD
jgi:DNA replication protein DnaC